MERNQGKTFLIWEGKGGEWEGRQRHECGKMQFFDDQEDKYSVKSKGKDWF